MSLAINDLRWGHPVAGGGWRQLFDGLNFSCPSGQFVVVIGNNGSGKSTLLNLTAGTLRLGSGSISLDGRPLHRYRTIVAPAGLAGSCRTRWRAPARV